MFEREGRCLLVGFSGVFFGFLKGVDGYVLGVLGRFCWRNYLGNEEDTCKKEKGSA